MGLVMGAIATGVLIGYPMGGILFDFVGESCPFIVIVIATSITLGNSRTSEDMDGTLPRIASFENT